MKKVGVTGGAGFVGTNLVRELLKSGFEVIVVDDLSTGLEANLKNLDLEFAKISITDESKLRSAFRNVDCIYHLAARGSVPRSLSNPRATFEVNVTGTQNILEIARENGAKIIYSSSSSVYGSNLELPKNEKMWVSPISPYAASKLSAEALVQSYAKSYGINAVTFRFFNIFGPFQRPDHNYAAVIPKWIWKAMNNLPIVVFGDGLQTRDFTYIRTVIDTLVATTKLNVSHEDPINLAFGNRISLNQVIENLKSIFPNLKAEYTQPRKGDVADSQNDPYYLKSIFPSVQPEPFLKSLESTVEWFSTEIKQVLDGPEVTD